MLCPMSSYADVIVVCCIYRYIYKCYNILCIKVKTLEMISSQVYELSMCFVNKPNRTMCEQTIN